jgi:copper chaperone CopZ
MAQQTEWMFRLAGLTCGHCARAVDDALLEVPGVLHSRTSHPDQQAVVVVGPEAEPAQLVAAIEAAGYRVLERSSRPG